MTHESAYEALKAHFTEEEQVKLTLLINVINGWNRIAVGFGVFARSGGRKVHAGQGGRLMADATPEDATDAAASFDPLRPKLMRVAYRMLGSVADAEDIVQEAFIRWMRADRSEVREPEAFLRRTVTRLCLDQLKSARRQRETYIGPWLPEPVVEEDEEEDVTLPLMLALERLSPLERAAFLLHDVFGLGFEEVAETIERDPAACRQLAARARIHVREARPRFQVDKQSGLETCRGVLRRLAQRRHEGAWRNAGGRCQRPCRRRRQAAGGPGADRRIRCRHEGVSELWRLTSRRMARSLCVLDSSTDCPASSRWRPTVSSRRPRSISRTERSPQSTSCEIPTS